MLAVTTFSTEGYEQYGKTCLETLEKFWPGRIIAYIEGVTPLHGRVEYRPFDDIPGWREWFERASKHPGSGGDSGQGYDFRYNALKFCRKVFAQDAVFGEDDHVWWIDADCVIRKDIPEALLFGLLEKWALAFLGRKGEQTYTETGVIGFNTKHADFAKFRAAYLPWITGGKIFTQLKGWHDCIAFDHAREGIASNNLTPNGRAMENVINESALGPFCAHLKGPRKFSDKHKRSALAA